MRCLEGTGQPVDTCSCAEQEVIRKAIAKASASVDGVGVDAESVVVEEIAQALAIALAQAVAEVFCDQP